MFDLIYLLCISTVILQYDNKIQKLTYVIYCCLSIKLVDKYLSHNSKPTKISARQHVTQHVKSRATLHFLIDKILNDADVHNQFTTACSSSCNGDTVGGLRGRCIWLVLSTDLWPVRTRASTAALHDF